MVPRAEFAQHQLQMVAQIRVSAGLTTVWTIGTQPTVNAKVQIVVKCRHKHHRHEHRLSVLFQMELFFRQTPDSGAGETPREQAVETVRNNIRWLNNNLEEIAAWLRAKVPEA